MAQKIGQNSVFWEGKDPIMYYLLFLVIPGSFLRLFLFFAERNEWIRGTSPTLAKSIKIVGLVFII